MKEHKVEQRSDSWFLLRRGSITCSTFAKLMPTQKQKPGTWNDTQLKILRTVAAEIMTGEDESNYTSAAMQHGIDYEDEARHTFEAVEFEEVRESGYWEYSDMIGGSPDGIIVRDVEDWGTLELKAPTSKEHVRYLLDAEELFRDYGHQVMGQSLVTGLRPYAIASYDPRFKDASKRLVVYRGTFTDEDLEPMRQRLSDAVEMIRSWI